MNIQLSFWAAKLCLLQHKHILEYPVDSREMIRGNGNDLNVVFVDGIATSQEDLLVTTKEIFFFN